MAFNNKDLESLLNEGQYREAINYGANTGLRAKKLANRVSFEVTKRVSGGRNTTSTVGYYPDMTLKEALGLSHGIRSDADKGLNPRVEKTKRQAQTNKGFITLESCIQEHLHDRETARPTPVPPNTIRQIWSAFKLCSPSLMHKPIAEITSEQLRECFNFMSSSQYKNRNGTAGARRQAEIWMAYAKAIFRMAHEIKDYIDVNPCPKAFYKITREIKSYDHFLQPSEVSKMITLINDMEEYQTGFMKSDVIGARLTQFQAIKLNVLTGLRNQSELYTIKWQDVKLDITKPKFYYMTSKQQQPLEVPITPIMAEVFRAQAKRRCNSYVFPATANSKEPDTYIKGVFKAMARLRQLLESSYGITSFENSEVFNNLMLRHTFTTLANRVKIPLEDIDKMSGHVKTKNDRSTQDYITALAEDMRPNYIKLHEFMLAGKDFEDSDVSEETLKLKHNSLVARLNTPRGKHSKLNYFNENFPATTLGQATRILKISKHHYTRFYEDLSFDKDEIKEYEPVIEMTGYLVELPKFIVKSIPEYMRREFYTLITTRELSENRAEAMKLGDIAEQELDEGNTYDEGLGEFLYTKKVQVIRDELGDPYENADYYKKMPKDKMEKRKNDYVKHWLMMEKKSKNYEWKDSNDDPTVAPEWFKKTPEEKWDRAYNRGSTDFQPIELGEEHAFNEYNTIKRAIDKSPEDPIAKKALEDILARTHPQKDHTIRMRKDGRPSIKLLTILENKKKDRD